jgi:4-hydroxybenzoate polyprenyltransferase
VILPGFSFNVQALWGSNWLLVFLMLQSLYWPYRFRFINVLETISLTLTILTFNCGWYIGTSNYRSNSSDSDESVSSLIVALNVMFLVFMIFVIVLNALRSVKKVYKTAGAENDKVEDGALEIFLRSKTPLLASTSNAGS